VKERDVVAAEEALHRRRGVVRRDQLRVHDLLRIRVRADDELLAQVGALPWPMFRAPASMRPAARGSTMKSGASLPPCAAIARGAAA
jgi:hypothetical protein